MAKTHNFFPYKPARASWRGRIGWLFGLGLALALAIVFVPAPAQARQLQIQKFSADVFVQSDSVVDVTETLDINFIGAWNGLYRTIPVEYETPQGFNYSLFVKLEGAADGAGMPLKVDSDRQGHYLRWRIYVPGADNAERTIVLHYRVSDALRFFEDHDELYWNVTGDEWDVPIESASAHILLPQGVTGVRALAFTGAYGSRAQNADVTIADNTVDIVMRRPLLFHEGLTAVIGWDKGFVTPPSRQEQIEQFFQSNWPLFFPGAVFLAMFWLWYARGRDPRMGAIAVQYAPPDGMTPAEAGTLVADNTAMRDITATIVDLAVRGYLTIEEKNSSQMMGLLNHKDYIFHQKKKPAEWTNLKAHELALMAGIFDNGAVADVELSSLQNQFYRNLPSINNNIFDALMEHGYFQHRPDTVRSTFIGIGIVCGVLLLFLGNNLAQRLGMAPAPFLIAAVASAIVIIGFGWFMPARTTAGVQALAGVLGFENFLTHVEADRMDRINQTPETFEKFLPFAMALGVEKKWVKAFQNIYTQPPAWYTGGYYGSGFYPILFVNELGLMSTRVGTVMASAPRSAGGSGFGGGGGGGYSGGGYGGGGGGGF